MSAPKKTAPPPGYAEVEEALHQLGMGKPSRWVAARLQAVDNPAAQEAVRLLHARECDVARDLLEAELLRLAGPADACALGWFSPTTEQVRSGRLPW